MFFSKLENLYFMIYLFFMSLVKFTVIVICLFTFILFFQTRDPSRACHWSRSVSWRIQRPLNHEEYKGHWTMRSMKATEPCGVQRLLNNTTRVYSVCFLCPGNQTAVHNVNDYVHVQTVVTIFTCLWCCFLQLLLQFFTATRVWCTYDCYCCAAPTECSC